VTERSPEECYDELSEKYAPYAEYRELPESTSTRNNACLLVKLKRGAQTMLLSVRDTILFQPIFGKVEINGVEAGTNLPSQRAHGGSKGHQSESRRAPRVSSTLHSAHEPSSQQKQSTKVLGPGLHVIETVISENSEATEVSAFELQFFVSADAISKFDPKSVLLKSRNHDLPQLAFLLFDHRDESDETSAASSLALSIVLLEPRLAVSWGTTAPSNAEYAPSMRLHELTAWIKSAQNKPAGPRVLLTGPALPPLKQLLSLEGSTHDADQSAGPQKSVLDLPARHGVSPLAASLLLSGSKLATVPTTPERGASNKHRTVLLDLSSLTLHSSPYQPCSMSTSVSNVVGICSFPNAITMCEIGSCAMGDSEIHGLGHVTIPLYDGTDPNLYESDANGLRATSKVWTLHPELKRDAVSLSLPENEPARWLNLPQSTWEQIQSDTLEVFTTDILGMNEFTSEDSVVDECEPNPAGHGRRVMKDAREGALMIYAPWLPGPPTASGTPEVLVDLAVQRTSALAHKFSVDLIVYCDEGEDNTHGNEFRAQFLRRLEAISGAAKRERKQLIARFKKQQKKSAREDGTQQNDSGAEAGVSSNLPTTTNTLPHIFELATLETALGMSSAIAYSYTVLPFRIRQSCTTSNPLDVRILQSLYNASLSAALDQLWLDYFFPPLVPNRWSMTAEARIAATPSALFYNDMKDSIEPGDVGVIWAQPGASDAKAQLIAYAVALTDDTLMVRPLPQSRHIFSSIFAHSAVIPQLMKEARAALGIALWELDTYLRHEAHEPLTEDVSGPPSSSSSILSAKVTVNARLEQLRRLEALAHLESPAGYDIMSDCQDETSFGGCSNSFTFRSVSASAYRSASMASFVSTSSGDRENASIVHLSRVRGESKRRREVAKLLKSTSMTKVSRWAPIVAVYSERLVPFHSSSARVVHSFVSEHLPHAASGDEEIFTDLAQFRSKLGTVTLEGNQTVSALCLVLDPIAPPSDEILGAGSPTYSDSRPSPTSTSSRSVGFNAETLEEDTVEEGSAEWPDPADDVNRALQEATEALEAAQTERDRYVRSAIIKLQDFIHAYQRQYGLLCFTAYLIIISLAVLKWRADGDTWFAFLELMLQIVVLRTLLLVLAPNVDAEQILNELERVRSEYDGQPSIALLDRQGELRIHEPHQSSTDELDVHAATWDFGQLAYRMKVEEELMKSQTDAMSAQPARPPKGLEPYSWSDKAEDVAKEEDDKMAPLADASQHDALIETPEKLVYRAPEHYAVRFLRQIGKNCKKHRHELLVYAFLTVLLLSVLWREPEMVWPLNALEEVGYSESHTGLPPGEPLIGLPGGEEDLDDEETTPTQDGSGRSRPTPQRLWFMSKGKRIHLVLNQNQLKASKTNTKQGDAASRKNQKTKEGSAKPRGPFGSSAVEYVCYAR